MKSNLLRSCFALLAGAFCTASAWGFAYITDNRTQGALPVKWPPGTVSIQIKLGSDRTLLDGTNFSTSAQAAAQTWNPLLGNLQIVPAIVPVSQAGERNNLNELVFAENVFGAPFEANTIAVTTTWFRGNERTQADIIFNASKAWDSYRGNRGVSIDIRRVALHELGHLLGLDHPDEAGQTHPIPLPIMNSRITDNDALTSDDVTGVQNLYGPPGPPANDNFDQATAITLTNNATTVTGFNTNATKQAGEPNHAGNGGGRSIWWKWTAPAAGPLTVDTRGSYCDTTLGVYTGGTVNSLATVGSNDDLQNDQTAHIQASSVNLTATGGTTYFFAVDGFDGDSSGITLNLNFTATGPSLPVITAQPVGATVTTGGSASFSVTATGATGYQWTFNGSNISGATGTTHTISSVTSAHAGSYRVVVSNGVGSVNSDTVTLTVSSPPPPPAPPPSSGGGGGGAPSLWFYGALSLLGLARYLRRASLL